MAWNPSPQVAVARDAAKALKANRCIVLYTNEQGQIGYASYGETKQLCKEAKQIADSVYEAAMDWFEVMPHA